MHKKTKWDIEREKKAALSKEFETSLRAIEDTLDRLADSVLFGGKFYSCARERTGEYLSDARRSVRAVRNHEDWQRRR